MTLSDLSKAVELVRVERLQQFWKHKLLKFILISGDLLLCLQILEVSHVLMILTALKKNFTFRVMEIVIGMQLLRICISFVS